MAPAERRRRSVSVTGALALVALLVLVRPPAAIACPVVVPSIGGIGLAVIGRIGLAAIGRVAAVVVSVVVVSVTGAARVAVKVVPAVVVVILPRIVLSVARLRGEIV
jgi:hypothetical protein